MPNLSYYPPGQAERVAWWNNILHVGAGNLAAAGYSPAEIDAILADARWAVFCYRDLRLAFVHYQTALLRYADLVLTGDPADPVPPLPKLPAVPTLPAPAVLAGIEARRVRWVATLKNRPGYTATLGTALGVEGNVRHVAPKSRGAGLRGLASPEAGIVTGKFAKGGGRIEGIALYGRPSGVDTSWTALGRFTASPFRATVPQTGAGPQEWEFQARTVRRDVEYGDPSDVYELIVRGR